KHITAGYVITDEGPVDVENLPPIPLEDEGMGTQSQVIRTGKPLYLPDLSGALEKTKTEYTLKSGGDVLEGSPPDNGRQRSRSAMYVPLLHASEVIGVMQVQSYDINAYNQEQLNLLSNFANVVALAVLNAKLFETGGESEDRYRLLVENTLDGVYIRDENVFLDLNQQMADMIGKDRSELIGSPTLDCWTPETQERIEKYLRIDSGHVTGLELLLSDGSIRIVEAFGKSCLYDGKDARIVAIKDISEQRKAQQETKQAADTALLYLDIMSHDVRNQLQAVVMASEIMQHMELDVESILALEIITESVEKSQKLINKVLSTRELLSIPLSEFSLNTALKNSLESM
ncbi:MAG: PAS domain S-box protein, partial [Candidatus Thorarchaeota archaeon]|nr:PAS domain S-box protein [Candidatus Thorarchaeota archaeon]